MIKFIRIENLRSLKDTGFVELRPLTLLLGANSSGKSTFLRSFPLFTQSVNKKLKLETLLVFQFEISGKDRNEEHL